MKLLAAFVLGVVILVGAALFFADRLIGTAIEKGGEAALGVKTRVGLVTLRPIAGRFGLRGLRVANPAGFSDRDFFDLGSIRVDLPLSRLSSDPLVIPSVEIDGVSVRLEQRGGRTNYGVLLDQLGTGASAQPSGAGGESDASGPDVAIQRLVIRNVHADLRLVGKLSEIRVDVPEISLRDVGSASHPLEMAQVVAVVTRAILQGIARSGGGLPGAIARQLRGRLQRLGSLPAGLSGSAKTLEDRAGRAVGEARDKGQKLLEGAGSLFRGGRKR
ncbi:MAG: hypothetical protein ACE5IL_15970 [Myxococcota bacterium]